MALFALLATAVPDLHGLPVGRVPGDHIGFASHEPRPEEALNALHSALRSLEEFDEEFDEDGDPLFAGHLGFDPAAAASALAAANWVLPTRRPCAHQATGPPSAEA